MLLDRQRRFTLRAHQRVISLLAPRSSLPDKNHLAVEARLLQALHHQGIVVADHHRLGILEEAHLLQALLAHRREVLLMGRSQRGEDAQRGLDDVVQGLHLALLADASLEDAHLRMLVEQPYRQRHTHLRVVAAGRAHHVAVFAQQLVEPLLDHRLAVRACDAHDGEAEDRKSVV